MEMHATAFTKNRVENTKEQTEAVVIGLYGELGSGKTTFVKGVAKAFGLEQTVTSPTFVIEKIYPIGTDGRKRPTSNGASKLKNHPFENFIHIDAYRLESGNELLTLGWDTISKDQKNIIFIEWPENVKEILPENMIKIKFEIVGKEERKIVI